MIKQWRKKRVSKKTWNWLNLSLDWWEKVCYSWLMPLKACIHCLYSHLWVSKKRVPTLILIAIGFFTPPIPLNEKNLIRSKSFVLIENVIWEFSIKTPNNEPAFPLVHTQKNHFLVWKLCERQKSQEKWFFPVSFCFRTQKPISIRQVFLLIKFGLLCECVWVLIDKLKAQCSFKCKWSVLSTADWPSISPSCIIRHTHWLWLPPPLAPSCIFRIQIFNKRVTDRDKTRANEREDFEI